MPIYMNVSGIDGDSADAHFPNWFELSSYSWGETQTVAVGGGGGGTGKVQFQDFHFSKRTGKGSPLLFLACASGKHLPAVQVVFTTGQKGRQEVYLKIELEDVLISSYQQSGDAGGLPQDEVSLNFGKIEFDQTIGFADGSVRVQSAAWDLRTNRGG